MKEVMKHPDFWAEHTLLMAQELVCELLEARKKDTKWLAKKMKVPENFIKGWLSGEVLFDLEDLGKICFHLGYELQFTTKVIK